MPTAQESSHAQSQIESALDSGLNAISQKQQVVFSRYQRFSLNSDGSIFWVNTSALLTATGSLHYATDRIQSEDETYGHNDMIFSSEEEITRFNDASPGFMWIGSWDIDGASPLRVAFSQRGNFFPPANVWHYQGVAVLPIMQAQLLDSAADLPAGPIVSNSLPIWLSLNTFAGRTVPIAPSFLVPDNLEVPYIVAHIAPELTIALGAFPIIGPWPGTIIPNSGAAPLHALPSSQLCRDEVTLTLYGFSNQMAIQYLGALIEASIEGTAAFGFADSPVIRDEKRIQVELSAIAQKKTLQISANYNQGAADAAARRLILSAMVSSIDIIGGVVPQGAGATPQGEQTVSAVGSVFE